MSVLISGIKIAKVNYICTSNSNGMHTFRFLKATAACALLFATAFFFVSCDQTGTTTTFSGTVTDVLTKQSLEGVAVSVMPFGLGEETDTDGKFSIALPRTDESVYLVFSKPGYDTQETLKMPLSPRKKNLYTFNIQLMRRVAMAVLSEDAIDFGGKETAVHATLSNPGNDTLSWNFLDLYFPEWLQAEPLGGILIPEATQELTFVCDRSELAIGNYTAEIQLVGGEDPLSVPVRMLVEGALLKVNGTSFDFGEEETEAVTTLFNEGNTVLNWHLEPSLPGWLSWEAENGTVEAGGKKEVKITVNRSELDYGAYTFTTDLLSDGGDTTYFFSIEKSADLIGVSVQSIDFGSESTQLAFTVSRVSGVHPVPFTVTTDDKHLHLSLTGGTITKEAPRAEVVVSLNREDIPAGGAKSSVRVLTSEQELVVVVNYATEAEQPEVSTDGYGLDGSWRLHFKGTLVSNGGGSVVQHGHCWGTSPQPQVTSGGGCSRLGSLEEGKSFVSYPDVFPEYGTTWYIRAYAENEMGISYGETSVMTYEPPVLKDPFVDYNQFSNVLIVREKNAQGTPFTEHGFVWNTTGEIPVLYQDTYVLLGEKSSGNLFYYNIPTPERGEEYTVRSFAVNSFGLAYSEPIRYFLDIEKPEVETGSEEEVTYYTAKLSGSIVALGSEEILAHGHCWSTRESPTLEDSYTNLGKAEGEGTFTSQAQGLLINTTYYYRAYVTTKHGVYYGLSQEFATLQDASVVVQDGLKMYITTSEQILAYDWTGAAHDLIVSNGITYNTSNKPAGTHAAISFNGTSGYLYSKKINPLSGLSGGSMNFWLRLRSTMNKNVKYPFFGSVSEGGFFVLIDHNGNEWVLTLCMGPGQETYKIALPSMGGIDISNFLGTAWHMLSIVSNGSTMSVYLDGTKLYTESIKMTFGVQQDFVIGAHALNGSTLNTFLPADMASLRFYNRVLSDTEVAAVYNAGM